EPKLHLRKARPVLGRVSQRRRVSSLPSRRRTLIESEKKCQKRSWTILLASFRRTGPSTSPRVAQHGGCGLLDTPLSLITTFTIWLWISPRATSGLRLRCTAATSVDLVALAAWPSGNLATCRVFIRLFRRRSSRACRARLATLPSWAP